MPLLLSACAPKPERVTDEELTVLREKYPYNDKTSEAVNMMSYKKAYPTLDAVFGIISYQAVTSCCAVVVLELKKDWYDINTNVSVFDDEKLNAAAERRTPGIGNIRWMVHNAVVKDILWSSSNLKKGDTIVLGFGSTAMTAMADFELIYASGNRYVCFLYDESSLCFNVENLYSTSKAHSFYLTDKDVLLSVTSAPGPDSVSGMYLPTFKQLVNETFAPAK